MSKPSELGKVKLWAAYKSWDDGDGCNDEFSFWRGAMWMAEQLKPTIEQYATMRDWGYDHPLDGDCDFGWSAREGKRLIDEVLGE